MSSNPEASPFIQQGNVVYLGVASPDELDDRIRQEIAGEEVLLNGLLDENHRMLVEMGLAQKAIDFDRAMAIYEGFPEGLGEGFEVEGFEGDFDEAFDGQEPNEESNGHLDGLEDRMISVDGSTQFRVAENLEAEEPCDPSATGGALFVVIYNNGTEMDGLRFYEVGNRLYMPDDTADIIMPSAPGMPEELILSELEVATIGSLVDRIKGEWQKGNLPHLGESGRYDTLVVETDPQVG